MQKCDGSTSFDLSLSLIFFIASNKDRLLPTIAL